MSIALSISPHGRLLVLDAASEPTLPDGSWCERVLRAFSASQAKGLLELGARELASQLPPEFAWARDFACRYLTALCHAPVISGGSELPALPMPDTAEFAAAALEAPPMRGLEYLSPDCFVRWWQELDSLVHQEARASGLSARDYLHQLNPAWRTVGRVTFHLAENKRDPESPFAFLATYATRLSAQGKAQHLPLNRALQEYAGAKNRAALLALLQPIQQAAESVAWVKELADSSGIYQPLAWTPREAYQFLQSIPVLESSGLIVRVPDWWKAAHPPRPVVSVKIGQQLKGKLGVDALLDFSVQTVLDGDPLNAQEIERLLRLGDRTSSFAWQMGRGGPGEASRSAETVEEGGARGAGRWSHVL